MALLIVNSLTNNTFANCSTVVNANLRNVPFINNDMTKCFDNCSRLYSVSNINIHVNNMSETFTNSGLTVAPTIPNNVVYMWKTFQDCANLTTAPATIPNSVTDIRNCFTNTKITTAPTLPNGISSLFSTFYNCRSLTTIPTIPESVTNLSSTFYGCSNLTTVTTLPNNITSLRDTFASCTKLTSVTATIPNSVTDMYQTFWQDVKLETISTEIPNSVVTMDFTFANDILLTTVPNIPESVKTMYYTFAGCQNLTGNIYIYSNQITSAGSCFNTFGYAVAGDRNVYIPFKYENGVNTTTYNSFITAGYDTAGTLDRVYLKDINPSQQQLYAWTHNDCTVYTTTDTPIVYDEICDNTGEDIDTAVLDGNNVTALRLRAYDSTNNTITLIGAYGG
jgi:hypothetical protein